jgi:hypothetical protein
MTVSLTPSPCRFSESGGRYLLRGPCRGRSGLFVGIQGDGIMFRLAARSFLVMIYNFSTQEALVRG